MSAPHPPPSPLAPFPVLIPSTLRPTDHTLPAFMVSTPRGFLPRGDPIHTLPPAFAPLSALLAAMPIRTASGTPGLLARFSLGRAIDAQGALPDLTAEVERHRDDRCLMTALYRDYAFVASAYLLEPCHERWVGGKQEEGYGLGRERLPKCVARPIVRVAEIAGFKPFMEYAGSYALYNYRLEDPARGLEYDNLRLIRAFEHGLDPTSSEAGFVLVHVAMVRHSGKLVEGSMQALEGCEKRERDKFNEGMKKVVKAMSDVNRVMNEMWSKSKPASYTNFRTFIFGITSQSMFPNGVIYEGVSDEPKSFRGESGANDSMIPLLDNLLQITMPATPLTSILQDFRSYRPGNHREFLEWVAAASTAYELKTFALADPTSAALYVRALDQVRDFRWRHWCFTREYILKNTSHPTATGGSPIVTWLPNQLNAVLSQMASAASHCGSAADVEDIMDTVRSQQSRLQKEVEKYCLDRQIVT
ncbi:IDO-domain-containing protein [Lineolata rhizophorae]|uniref:Indoleamine 2,3-dioxygenase n=1 Tax=Lineolata rhizophorae TaxID=578093 RepID=A0A6A6NQB7_9PEZI|nr:IDO-domain-containing protein [Lineolata rhizophorae]